MNIGTQQSFQPKPFVFEHEPTVLPPRDAVRLDLPRYVFCLGDFIEPNDKIQLMSLHSWIGGLRIGSSTNEGAPTMVRTNHIIYRGMFTPLELTAIPAHADVRTTETVMNGGKMNIMPGHDIKFLTSDDYSEMGVVEISALSGEPFATGAVERLNNTFFPDLAKWRTLEMEMPTLLADWVDLIRSVKASDQVVEQTRNEMLTSATRFNVYARKQIEINRQRIMQTRSIDTGGFTVGWSARSRLFASQLDIVLEDDNVYRENRDKIRIASSGEVQNSAELDDLRRRDVESREEANRIARESLEMQQFLNRDKLTATNYTLTYAGNETPVTAQVNVRQCAAIAKVSGKQCKNKAIPSADTCELHLVK